MLNVEEPQRGWLSNLPFHAFVFKGFNIVGVLIGLFLVCLPGLLSATEETNSSLTENERPLESAESPRLFEQPAPLEPTRAHESVPYQFPLEETRPAPEEEDHFFGQFMKMLGVLGLLIAIMFITSWSLKRILHTRVQQLNESSLIRIIEQRSLSNKSALYIIEIQDQTLLVGESMHSLTILTALNPNKEKS